jgi:hypothetical protein
MSPSLSLQQQRQHQPQQSVFREGFLKSTPHFSRASWAAFVVTSNPKVHPSFLQSKLGGFCCDKQPQSPPLISPEQVGRFLLWQVTLKSTPHFSRASWATFVVTSNHKVHPSFLQSKLGCFCCDKQPQSPPLISPEQVGLFLLWQATTKSTPHFSRASWAAFVVTNKLQSPPLISPEQGERILLWQATQKSTLQFSRARCVSVV